MGAGRIVFDDAWRWRAIERRGRRQVNDADRHAWRLRIGRPRGRFLVQLLKRAHAGDNSHAVRRLVADALQRPFIAGTYRSTKIAAFGQQIGADLSAIEPTAHDVGPNVAIFGSFDEV